MTNRPTSPPGATKPPLSVWGILLVGIGLIILLPCGLCTAGFLATSASEFFQDGRFEDFSSSAGLILLVGGIPTGFGALLVFFGTRLRKAA